MKLIFFLMLFGTVLQYCQSAAPDPNKMVLVTVFYSSKSQESKNFILKQLVPAMNLLKKHIKLKFVPFGKSKSLENGVKGFSCTYGPRECLGNLVQDCALNLISYKSDVDRLAYVACEMKTGAAVNAEWKCGDEARVPLDKLAKCVASDEGIRYQLISERLTDIIMMDNVPTITVDNHFYQHVQDLAQTHFYDAVCSLMTEVPPCFKHYNASVLQDLMRKKRPLY